MDQRDKQLIEKLVRKYESLTDAQRKGYNESMTCKDFILPLFQSLGWDVFNHVTADEVTSETQVSGKRVDYAFHLNGVTMFFLEAKKFSVDLREKRWAEQAVMYSWHKGIAWAVLTDFQSIKVFNAEWDEPDPEQNLLFEIPYTAYLTDERIQLLSKEAMGKGFLDEYADKNFKKPKREPVDKQLANDLIRWRKILFINLKRWNSDKPLTAKHIAESVQRVLDRLIFIRTTEDRGIEDKHLQGLVRNYRENRENFDLIEELKKLFKDYDEWYNSKLFEHHACDTLEYESSFLADVIDELYKNRKGIRYDFSSINADVLGSIYEQYLGHVQQVGESDEKSKRKEQGIFYTPRHIVDYIVRNTLGEVLKGRPAHEALRVKILDPACGSGSFLLNAFETLDNYVARKSGRTGINPLNEYIRKSAILTSNIYGVDLDPEAVEIAQLNLLLRVVDRREKLPNLAHNIECGNSLISGTEKELSQYFGKNWKDKKPFNWEVKFSNVFKQGGFDIIIGNPPYIKEYVDKSAFDGLHDSPYYQGKMDIWTLFACQAIDHLKDGGYFSFIAPNSWLTNAGASIFREKVLKEGEIMSFIDFGDFKVFKDAGIQTMIFVFKKGRPRKKYPINYVKVLDSAISDDKIALFLNSNFSIGVVGIEKTEIYFEPEKYYGKFISFSSRENNNLISKIEKCANFKLQPKDVGQGIVCPQEYVTQFHIDVLRNSNIKIGDGIFVLKKIELKRLELSQKEKEAVKPFYTTTELGRFFADEKNVAWILYMDTTRIKDIDSCPHIKKHLDKFKKVMTSDSSPYGLHRARDKNFFEGKAIFSLRKTSIPAFSYVEFPCYVSQSFYVIKPENINLRYLAAILNSCLAYFWFKNRGKVQGDNLQIDKEPLINFPIAITGDKNRERKIVILVDKIMALNTEFHHIDPILEKEGREELKNEIKKTEAELDKKVYMIYSLTPEEIKIVESRKL